MQLPSFIGTCDSCKTPVSQAQVCWAVSGLFQTWPKFAFTSRLLWLGSTQWMSLHRVSSLEALSCAAGSASPLATAALSWGARRSPLSEGMLQHTQASQCQCVGRREDATHERVMTTPTQLWQNVLDTLLWQPKSISGDCGFPLKEWWAHTSSRRGVSPLPLYPFSHRVKVCSHWNLSSFSERDILNPTGDTESEQIQLIPLCQLVTAHPAAVNAQ